MLVNSIFSFIVLISKVFFLNPLPNMPVLGSSNSTAKRYDVKNMDKWGYSYLIELKTLGIGKISHYQQFLLFPRCFQKLSVVDASK